MAPMCKGSCQKSLIFDWGIVAVGFRRNLMRIRKVLLHNLSESAYAGPHPFTQGFRRSEAPVP